MHVSTYICKNKEKKSPLSLTGFSSQNKTYQMRLKVLLFTPEMKWEVNNKLNSTVNIQQFGCSVLLMLHSMHLYEKLHF